MKNKKGFKHYLQFYVLIVIVYFLYISILAMQNDGYDSTMLFSLIYLPPAFVGFIYLFDSIMEPFFNKMKQPKKNSEASLYKQFFQVITNQVNTQCDFSIEDFRRLRESDKFQKALQQAYKIKTEGETPDLNFVLLDKKFKKETREYEAMQVVIEEVKKMMTNEGKDYQK